MPAYEIKDASRITEVVNVTNIAVTAIVADALVGGYSREVRIFGIGQGEESEAVVMTLRLRAPTSDPLEIEVPASQF